MNEQTDPETPPTDNATPAANVELPISGQPDSAAEDAANNTEGGGNRLLDALKEVIDPELMVNIVDLGLVYDVEQTDAIVNVDMTLTSPACPVGPQIMQQAKMALERLDDVEEAKIQLVMSPAWSPDRMTDDARDQLGIF